MGCLSLVSLKFCPSLADPSNPTTNPPIIPEAPNVPFFVGTRKPLELPSSARPPKKPRNARPPKSARPNPLLPSRGRRALLRVFVSLLLFVLSLANMCARFADICARVALRFLLAPFENSTTDHLGGPTSPALGKTLEAGKRVFW